MCERCEDLEEELAYLRSELGLRIEASDIAALQYAFGLTPSEARLVLALYQAKGRPVSQVQLEDAVVSAYSKSDRQPGIIPVYICKIRKKLGRDSITTIWGNGFLLGPEAAGRVNSALATRAKAA